MQRDESDARWLNGAAAGDCIDAPGGHLACFLRRFAGAHRFGHEQARSDAKNFFADAGAACGADFVIDVESRADDRGIADASGPFVRQAGRRADAAQ